MKIQIKNNGVKIPKQATPQSVGFDIEAVLEPLIVGESIELPMDFGTKLYKRIDFIEYSTNLFISPQNVIEKASTPYPETTSFFTMLASRSSITKKNLILKNSLGIIDTDYTGQILVRFAYIPAAEDMVIVPEAGFHRIYIKINQDKIYQKGDFIAQLVAGIVIPTEFEFVEKLSETKRGSGGFGSTN